MKPVKEQIEDEVKRLREKGVTGSLVILPIVHKRCFLPCEAGKCNCRATIDGRFCVMLESQKIYALDDVRRELAWLNGRPL